MNHSGDLAIALEHLRNANEAYCQAANALKYRQKTRAKCAEAFRKLKEKSGDKNYVRRVLDEAVLAEKATKEHMRNALEELRAKQSAYDKLKYLAVLERRAQKEAQAWAKREREQFDEGKKEQSEKKEAQEESKESKNSSYSSHSERKKENKKQKTRQKREPRSERKFQKDNRQEARPKAEQPEDKPRRKSRKPQRPSQLAIPKPPSGWKLACDKVLSDRWTMMSFPGPPYFSCENKACVVTRKQRALKACQCNITDAFQRDPEYPESLKAERLRWHPDKFSVCLEEYRLVFQAKAEEIFVVANHLYERDGKLM
jgi:hypothetical protein